MKIYVTFCSKKKDESLKGTGAAVPPCLLYKGKRICGFMERCKKKKLRWAIFSDKHGIWFPGENHEYYEKSPDEVTPQEFARLLKDFDTKLSGYDEICFYYGTPDNCVHDLYKKLLRETLLGKKLTVIRYAREIL